MVPVGGWRSGSSIGGRGRRWRRGSGRGGEGGSAICREGAISAVDHGSNASGMSPSRPVPLRTFSALPTAPLGSTPTTTTRPLLLLPRPPRLLPMLVTPPCLNNKHTHTPHLMSRVLSFFQLCVCRVWYCLSKAIYFGTSNCGEYI